MKELKKAKQDYDNIQIPSDFDSFIDNAIDSARHNPGFFKRFKTISVSFASLVLALNLFPVFASAMESLPLVGSFFQVLTFRHIETADETAIINADIPVVECYTLQKKNIQEDYNEEIYALITEKIEETLILAQQEQDSYLKGGGDSNTRPITEFYSSYRVRYEKDNILSFIVDIEIASSSVEHIHYYYNLNAETGKAISLKELIQEEDYISLINQEIIYQISQKEKENSDLLYFDDMDQFTTIDENQSFYINEHKQLVIVFGRYEIAPGYMGEQEFIMPFEIQLP